MTVEDFLLAFPEFQGRTDGEIQFYLNIGASLTARADLAALFVAHNLAMNTGWVVSDAVAQVNDQYSSDPNLLAQTKYGRQYLQLVKVYGQGCRQV